MNWIISHFKANGEQGAELEFYEWGAKIITNIKLIQFDSVIQKIRSV